MQLKNLYNPVYGGGSGQYGGGSGGGGEGVSSLSGKNDGT